MKRLLLFLLALSAVALLCGCGEHSLPGQNSVLSPDSGNKSETSEGWVCTFTIDCSAVFEGGGKAEPVILESLPADGAILAKQAVAFSDGESVCDVLRRICRENGIPLEVSVTPGSGSVYVKGICNLSEFDAGAASGWLYRVNGEECGFGSGEYTLSPGDNVEWRYSCDFGDDIRWENDIAE